MGYIYFSQTFKEQLLKYCSDEFILTNVQEFQDLPFRSISQINLIDATSWFNGSNNLRKVKFCLAWLQAVTADVIPPQYGIVLIDGIGYTSMRFTDFLCHLTNLDIISKEENMQLLEEWLDITEGHPYYDVD